MHQLIPDPFVGAPSGIKIVLESLFILFGSLCGWIALDTRRALAKLVAFTPGPAWLKIDPRREAWIWFYRIDAAIVFTGVILILAEHWFARSQ